MRRLGWLLAGIGLAITGCAGDTGGGGGTGGPISFSAGYVFVRRDDRNIYIADRSDYSRIGRLTTSGGNKHPSISRDGRKVVFVHTAGGATEIRGIPTSGVTESVIFPSDSSHSNLRNPVFSPDGASIVFSFDAGGMSALGLVSADTGSLQRTITPVSPSTLLISPSFGNSAGFLLAASGTSPSTLSQIVGVTLTSPARIDVIAANLGPDFQSVVNRVALSPDGTKATFDGRIGSGASRLVAFDLASRMAMRLTDYPTSDPANDTFPSWVGNATIGFTSNSGGNEQIYEVPSNGGSPNLKVLVATEGWYGPN